MYATWIDIHDSRIFNIAPPAFIEHLQSRQDGARMGSATVRSQALTTLAFLGVGKDMVTVRVIHCASFPATD